MPAGSREAFLDFVGRHYGRFLLAVNLLGLGGYYLYLLADLILITDQFRTSLIARSVLVGLGLANVYLVFRHLRKPLLMDMLMPVHDVFATLMWFEILKLSHSPDVDHFVYASMIFIVLGNLGVRASFRCALICSLLVSAGILVNVAQLVPPREFMVFSLAYLPMLLFSLFISWSNTRNTRLAFLAEQQSLQQRAELSRVNGALQRLAATDALTGVANRRAFDRDLQDKWEAMLRHGRGFGLLLVDVDYFKAFNDHYGHIAGDRCLAEAALGMRAVLRDGQARLYRYGGEEFAVLLQVTRQDELVQVAQRLVNAVTDLDIEHRFREEGPPRLTISVGAALAREDVVANAEGLLSRCDGLLYEAKRLGRNRLCLAYAAEPA